MTHDMNHQLSRRERQIMEIVYRKSQASAMEVLEALPDPPSYSAVRALLSILEKKGHLRHRKQANRNIYLPMQARQPVARTALQQLVHNFFGGSVENVVATLLTDEETKLSEEELARLAQLIENAREGGH